MNTLIVNITENKKGFEDRLANEVLAALENEYPNRNTLVNITNSNFDELEQEISKNDVIFLVGHGLADDDIDLIELFPTDTASTGGSFDHFRIFNNYELLAHFIGIQNHRFLLILCVCDGFCPSSLSITMDFPNLIGVIGSKTKVLIPNHQQALISLLKRFHQQWITDSRASKHVESVTMQWKKEFSEVKDFHFFPGFTIIDDGFEE
ncbi:MAG TPA: hypothetical protein PLK80_06935 [bacterium]|nr:MAG: hypothetical protein BWY28_02197 [bacterium ADurb.Bin236]HOY62143.1 hypothetical protein [bacterium]HPI76454.1 hypothetical protein [bacterium]HPN93708.1 hypothetical protein [bacterium]